MSNTTVIYDSRKQKLLTKYLQYYAYQKERWIVNIVSCNDDFLEECCLQPEKKVQLYQMVSYLQEHMHLLVPDGVTQTHFTISRPKSNTKQRKAG